MRLTRIITIAVVAAALPLAACSSATTTPDRTPAPTGPASSAAPGNRSAEELEAVFRARRDSARMLFTAADVRFMTDMIHHHAQAIEMSRLVPERASSSEIRTLAARIINAQKDEIATMQRWLRLRDQPVPEVHITDTEVMVHGGGDHAHMHMPGMLTPEQLGQLRAASGVAFDRLFLTLMIQHHEGAMVMVRELFSTDGAGQEEDVFRLASDVNVDQETEVARMKLMLAAMPSGS